MNKQSLMPNNPPKTHTHTHTHMHNNHKHAKTEIISKYKFQGDSPSQYIIWIKGGVLKGWSLHGGQLKMGLPCLVQLGMFRLY